MKAGTHLVVLFMTASQHLAWDLAQNWWPAHAPSYLAFKSNQDMNKNGGNMNQRDLQLALKLANQMIKLQFLLQI